MNQNQSNLDSSEHNINGMENICFVKVTMNHYAVKVPKGFSKEKIFNYVRENSDLLNKPPDKTICDKDNDFYEICSCDHSCEDCRIDEM